MFAPPLLHIPPFLGRGALQNKTWGGGRFLAFHMFNPLPLLAKMLLAPPFFLPLPCSHSYDALQLTAMRRQARRSRAMANTAAVGAEGRP